MNIHGKKVLIRAIEETDLELLHRWANDPAIWYQLGGWHFPSNRHEQQKWFESLSSNSTQQRFAITTEEHGLIGTTNLVDIDWKNNHAFHGMMLGDKDIRGKGYGIDSIMAIMRYAFEELHLARLDGSMIEYNQISLNIYLNRCGWIVEGRQRNWYYRQDRYWDRILVGITREDYLALIRSNNYWTR
ncbi:GNAT family N-acetyltransferase [Permianibacter sp. IMCC34836]|uniref:GNAT family N-acetyltransferase n=1 Tax=Permianibacter fluminis TaxID=2738515 RepID=UPI00155267A9|nr:GNAT family protein [Permianibacter fluminis]NQD38057.1 GNAT family N-acetyltransferase [Permianibacter fluminis]